ncbi:MAG TPA: serine hydrolase [Anaerolineae bacterium]|nr:serine hydrolase [Anaerolineae bacterium]
MKVKTGTPAYAAQAATLLILALLSLSCVGCAGVATTRESVNFGAPAETATPTAELAGSTVSNITRMAPPTGTPAAGGMATVDSGPQAEAAASRPAATATWPAGSDEVPCGVLLPILPADQALTDHLTPGGPALELVPDAALPALERLIAAPETVGLAAFEIGRESDGAYLNPDAPMPLASVVKIINLIAYAEAVAAGGLDPAEWIPLSELERSFLRRTDLGAHARALDGLEERRLIAMDPPATPLEEIPWMMIRHSSNAAADYIHLRLGQTAIEQTAVELGLDSQTAPCPWIGQFLMMANRQSSTNNRGTIQSYLDEPEEYGREAMRLAESYASDQDFRQAESSPGWRVPVTTQALFSDNLNAQASARDYAGLMARILRNELSSDYTNIVVRRALEWPMLFPQNQELFTAIGLKDGSLPGVLTTAYYAQRAEDGAQLVVVLFFRQLSRNTYRQWRQDLPHDEFARWLLSDPAAIPTLRETLRAD